MYYLIGNPEDRFSCDEAQCRPDQTGSFGAV